MDYIAFTETVKQKLSDCIEQNFNCDAKKCAANNKIGAVFGKNYLTSKQNDKHYKLYEFMYKFSPHVFFNNWDTIDDIPKKYSNGYSILHKIVYMCRNYHKFSDITYNALCYWVEKGNNIHIANTFVGYTDIIMRYDTDQIKEIVFYYLINNINVITEKIKRYNAYLKEKRKKEREQKAIVNNNGGR